MMAPASEPTNGRIKMNPAIDAIMPMMARGLVRGVVGYP